MSTKQRYRLRSPESGRELILEAKPDEIYVDGATGEHLEVVGKVVPLAPSPSNLPWSLDHLRMCGCPNNQMVQKDVNDCPYCDRRLDPPA